MDRFIRELEVGEIHQRDRLQFELKSEFFPTPKLRKNSYIQEFYLFIPNSLQINEENYSKSEFYQDQTNLIRYKTPPFELSELYDPKYESSPLYRLSKYRLSLPSDEIIPIVEDELKLFANIFRSSLRERIHLLIENLKENENVGKNIETLCQDLVKLRDCYKKIQADFLKRWTSSSQQRHFQYIDEFISNTINYYVTGFLQTLKRSKLSNREDIEKRLYALLRREKKHRQEFLHEPEITEGDTESNEYILYRSSLLNKFVMDALLLNTTRSSLLKRYRNIVGSFAAAVAMLFFFVLFVWQGRVFIINSLPFIIITVFLYVLKDRIKEGLKVLSYRQFTKWFADYETDIRSPDDEVTLGSMRESVSFVREWKLPKEIVRMRNREFHEVLEAIKRPEQVLYYKKEINIYHHKRPIDARRNALNLILRFNIHQFLKNADNPVHRYITVDPEHAKLIKTRLPKVYHLNIILKNTYLDTNLKKKTELKKFRLVLDKNGIKRVEHM